MQVRTDTYKSVTEVDKKIEEMQIKMNTIDMNAKKLELSKWHCEHIIEQLKQRRKELMNDDKPKKKKRVVGETASMASRHNPLMPQGNQMLIETFFKLPSEVKQASKPIADKKRIKGKGLG